MSGKGLSYKNFGIVSSGGIVTSTTVGHDSHLRIGNGGRAISSTVLAGGTETVTSGGFSGATHVTSGGVQVVEGGAITSGAIIERGGELVALDGANVIDLQILPGGRLSSIQAGTVVTGLQLGAVQLGELVDATELRNRKIVERCKNLKQDGSKRWIKILAEEFELSEARIKQILRAKSPRNVPTAHDPFGRARRGA